MVMRGKAVDMTRVEGIVVYENARNTALLTYTIGGTKSRTVKRKDRPAYPKMARRAYIAGIGSV